MRYTFATTALATLVAVSTFPGMSCSRELAPTHNYREVHSYPSSAAFDPRDGWKRIMVSDLQYKYPNQSSTPAMETAGVTSHHGRSSTFGRVFERSATRVKNVAKRSSKKATAKKTTAKKASVKSTVKAKAKVATKSKTSSNSGVGGALNQALQGIGKATSVVITWYTGNDLKNPSCWAKSVWTPTDEAFVCALTLKGWTDRPACFDFLELCNGPSKCIYVRTVDTCAGCAEGSHHVDLTRGAFTKLASLDTGILNVNMRMAKLPSNVVWDVTLWGPKK